MYTQKKPIENAHIVRERDRRRFRELSAVLFLAVPIGAFLLVFTCQNVEVIRLGSEATKLQQQRKSIEDANKVLQMELDRLTGLTAVEEKATALGFAPTDARSVVTVSLPTAAMPALPAPAAEAPRDPVVPAPPAQKYVEAGVAR